jgi:hypothetical protein
MLESQSEQHDGMKVKSSNAHPADINLWPL